MKLGVLNPNFPQSHTGIQINKRHFSFCFLYFDVSHNFLASLRKAENLAISKPFKQFSANCNSVVISSQNSFVLSFLFSTRVFVSFFFNLFKILSFVDRMFEFSFSLDGIVASSSWSNTFCVSDSVQQSHLQNSKSIAASSFGEPWFSEVSNSKPHVSRKELRVLDKKDCWRF